MNKTLDLKKYILPSTEHLKYYEKWGEQLRQDYLKDHPKKKIVQKKNV